MCFTRELQGWCLIHSVLLYGWAHSQSTVKQIIYIGNIIMREEDITITHITVMKWSLNQSTLDGLQILLISNFLLFMVLLRRLWLWTSNTNAMCDGFYFVGFEAYPSFSEVNQDINSHQECGRPVQMSFNAREVSDGTFFKAIEDYNPETKILLYQLQK